MKKDIIAIIAVLLLAGCLLCACTEPDTKTEYQETYNNSESAVGFMEEKDNNMQENAPAEDSSRKETQAGIEITEAEVETTEAPATEALVTEPPTTPPQTTNPPVTESPEIISPTEESTIVADETGEF